MNHAQSAPTLQGKVVMITGASSGIGLGAARALAEEGAILALCARRKDRLADLVQEIRASGGSAEFFALDVTKPSEIELVVGAINEKFGRIDHAFNNAGVGATHKNIVDTSEDEYDVVHDTCLKGAFFCLKYQMRVMAKTGGGSILNTSSVGGLIGVPGSADYSAAKHGLLGLTKSAAIEGAKDNIRVNAIAPGATMTDMYKRWLPTPEDQQRIADLNLFKRVASIEEVVRYVVFALREATFSTGTVFVCDGGMSVSRG